MHLILPSAEKIVWVTSVDAFDDILVSANHLEGTPRTRIVSGLFAIFLTGFPETSKNQSKSTKQQSEPNNSQYKDKPILILKSSEA